MSIGDIGLDPGAVKGERSDRDQAGLSAEDEDLGEELGQGVLVADAEAGDRGVVGALVGGNHAEGDVLVQLAFDPPRRALAGCVGVKQ